MVLTVPDVQVNATGTVAALSGMKSLITVIDALLRVLVIVQLALSATPTQFAWFAV